MAGYLNRHRASRLMQEQGLSALVLAQPETISYATGSFAGVASFWRRAGAAFVFVSADEALPLVAIVGDLQAKAFQQNSGIVDTRSHRIWVESDTSPLDQSKPRRTPRPAQFDITNSLTLLRDVIAERGLEKSRIGLELSFIPVADFGAFSKLPVSWIDCSSLVENLRAIKSNAEITKLRRAAQYSMEGISSLTKAIVPGMTASEMSKIWRDSALASAAARGHPPPQSTWSYIAVGGDGFAPGGSAKSGDIIKIDVGSVIDGYSSDGARTAVLGRPDPEAVKIFDALHRSFDEGLKHIEPGNALKDVYFAAAQKMWDQGFETYGRGHFGHGVGASVWSEEWPFISADATAILEPNMVLAFETPWYIEGLGGFIIEDQLLITERGFEVMAISDRSLLSI